MTWALHPRSDTALRNCTGCDCRVGQYNKLNHRVSRGNVDVLWDTDECAGRLVDVSARESSLS